MIEETLPIDVPAPGPSTDDRRVENARAFLASRAAVDAFARPLLEDFEAILGLRVLVPYPLPAWAAPDACVRIIASCSDCGTALGGEDDGGILFSSLEDIHRYIGDDDEDEADRHWLIVGR